MMTERLAGLRGDYKGDGSLSSWKNSAGSRGGRIKVLRGRGVCVRVLMPV
jgi:hypothetical protein